MLVDQNPQILEYYIVLLKQTQVKLNNHSIYFLDLIIQLKLMEMDLLLMALQACLEAACRDPVKNGDSARSSSLSRSEASSLSDESSLRCLRVCFSDLSRALRPLDEDPGYFLGDFLCIFFCDDPGVLSPPQPPDFTLDSWNG